MTPPPQENALPFAGRKVAILANGVFPAPGPERDTLDAADVVVCCDGAAAALLEYGRVPDLAAGDGDSIPEAALLALGGRFAHDPGQCDNDLAKAFRAATARGARAIAIVGASGGRSDHFISNVFLLASFAATDPDVRMETPDGVFRASTGRRFFKAARGSCVSVFAPFRDSRVSSRGLEWKLHEADLSMPYAGLSNRVAGEDGFEISSARPVIVYTPHAP